MKALCWHGKKDVRIDQVPDPKIINDRDAIIKVTSTAICGSDLHLFNGLMPTMKSGDILGHEFMGEVMEVGAGNKKLKVGDRVVVPFTIACGECFFCQKGFFSACELSNPNEELAKQQMGHSPAGLFGFSHLLGGFSGGQAEFVRVPFADVGPIKIPEGIPDEKVLFLSDIFPTGYLAAEHCDIEDGDTVAIWGCGPVAQFAIQSAWMLGAGRVIAIDCVAERLAMAEKIGKAETVNFEKDDVYDRLMTMTKGRGPDRCIDAVGAENHTGPTLDSYRDKLKQAVHLTHDRPHSLREAIKCCRNWGTISVPGAYIGMLDGIPFGSAMNRGITFKMGQTPVQKYSTRLLQKIINGEIDPSLIITHHLKLEDAPEAYQKFADKKDGCIKVVMKTA
jgi:threonine dehydrogenase-like Zn-dependent dehydrogenase